MHWWLMYTGFVVDVEMRVGGDGALGSGGRGRWCRLYTARSSRAAKSESASDASPSSRMGSQIDFRWANNPPSTNEFVFDTLLALELRLDTGPFLDTASENRAMGDDVGFLLADPELVLGVHVDKRACIHHQWLTC